MKLSITDYILLTNTILMLILLISLVYFIEYKSGIFIKNNVVSRFCNEQKKYDKELKGLLANKIRVKKFNDENFPDLKYPKTLFIFNLKKNRKIYI